MQAEQLSQILEQLAEESRIRLSRTESDLAETRHQQLVIKQRIATTYQQMASLLLQDNSGANDIKIVQDLLDNLQHELAQTQQELQLNENDILRQLKQLQALRKQIEPLETEREQLLQQNPDAIATRQTMVQFYDEANQQKIHHSELISETDRKLAEYINHPIFMFLIRKNYGQPNYRSWPISRNLDNWLARHINYTNNYANYQMLQALPKESGRRLEILQDQAEKRTNEYLNHLTKVEEKLNLPSYYQQFELLEKHLAVSQQKVRDLQDKVQQYSLGEGETFDRIAKQLSVQMASLPLEKLDALVAKTVTTDDDRLLGELKRLKQMGLKLEDTRREEEQYIVTAKPRASAAAILESAFLNSRLNNSDYEFRWLHSQEHSDLFESFLNGVTSLEQVFKKLNDIVRLASTTPTATDVITTIAVAAILSNRRSSGRSSGSSYSESNSGSSSTSSSSSSSSSSSGGGFSSSSSTGGGNFRSTDSF